jgi:hypothetical protein
MVSAYKEGRLVRAAIESLRRVDLDCMYVYEGPAGEPLGDDVPDSDYYGGYYVLREGRWRTDARKRDAMLQQAKKDFPGGPLWGVIVDGDEILVNGEYLRDRLQAIVWDDEARGADLHNADRPPTARWPLRLVESDGGISLITARVIRLDLVRSIDISSSVVTNISGVQEGWGNVAEDAKLWIDIWMHAAERGRMVCWPPLPCEPHIVHRSNLRHPARRGLRMSVQETELLDRAKREAGLT